LQIIKPLDRAAVPDQIPNIKTVFKFR